MVHIATTGLFCVYTATTQLSVTADVYKDHTTPFHATVKLNPEFVCLVSVSYSVYKTEHQSAHALLRYTINTNDTYGKSVPNN